MRRYCVRAVILILCVILSASGLQGQQVDKRKNRKQAEKHLNDIIVDRQSVVVDRDLLDVYARIMRYQTAWQDILSQTYGDESTVDDYLTIAVRNVTEGELKDLQNYLKRIKQPSSDVLAIDRQTRCGVATFDECELAYAARWAKEGAQYGLKFNTPNTGNVDYYITYDVTVEYGGKSVTHGGVIVHYRNKNAGFMIYDGIIPQIDELVLDKQPLMADNRRMSRAFGGTRPKAKVRELPAVKVWSVTPEEEEIIGWLPGDEKELFNDDTMMIITASTTCTPPELNGPASVTRGQSATFTLSELSSSYTISNWKFTGTDGGVVNRTSSTTATTWGGMMVAGGTVSVTVTQNGETYNLTKGITVNPRSNFAFTAVNAEQITNCSNLTVFPYLCIPVTPMQDGDRTGYFEIVLPYSFETLSVNDNGPNHGYWYTTSVTAVQGGATTRFGWTISPDVNNTSSEFYQAQCGNYNVTTYPDGYISGAKLRSNTIYHESASSPVSHYNNYVVAQNNPANNLGIVGEKVVNNQGMDKHLQLLNTALMNAKNIIIATTKTEPCGGFTNNDSANGCVYNGGINYKINGAYASCALPCATQCLNTYSQCPTQIETQCKNNCAVQVLSQYPSCAYNPAPCVPLIQSCISQNCSNQNYQATCTYQYNLCMTGCQ